MKIIKFTDLLISNQMHWTLGQRGVKQILNPMSKRWTKTFFY